jgi:Gamma-glutamyl cyclotransferase, AIG2-like
MRSQRILVYARPPMGERRLEAFFYGLYMDLDVLREAGVAPLTPRKAYVDGFALRIGRRATLLPSAGARAYGMLYTVTHDELERLYTAPGLEQYRPEAVMARPLEGVPTPALCYNLREAPEPHERNPEYAVRLQRALAKLAFPPEYVASVS